MGGMRPRPLVLCYHAVADDWPDALAVTLAAFERQLQAVLARGYRPVGAAEAVAGSGKLVHVTFDDAFRSVARAVPVLQRLGVPATVFACPGFADGDGTFAVPELAGRQPPEHADQLATMGWAELRELIQQGIEIGSHTLTHPHLTALDQEGLERELRESRERLEDELSAPCRFLAYPFGDEDERVRAAARASGYAAAFALPGTQTATDLYSVPRVGIWREDGPFRVRVKTSATGRRWLLDPLSSMRERRTALTGRHRRLPP
jgi:peptidoglycan/xylan/chitin deacetylase (PgdA/CDA1 family)